VDPVLIDKLEQFFSSDGGEIYRGSPASQEQINDAERRLGVKFDNDYAEFCADTAAPLRVLPSTASTIRPCWKLSMSLS